MSTTIDDLHVKAGSHIPASVLAHMNKNDGRPARFVDAQNAILYMEQTSDEFAFVAHVLVDGVYGTHTVDLEMLDDHAEHLAVTRAEGHSAEGGMESKEAM